MKVQSWNMGHGFAPTIQRSQGIAFAIPGTRLICVEYVGCEHGKATVYNATLPRPASNADMQIALLKRRVAMSQVIAVKPVVEWSRPQCRD